MRTLISKLNDIRDTRNSGILRNRFERISTGIAGLAGEYLGGVLPEPMPATLRVVPATVMSGTSGSAIAFAISGSVDGFGKPLHASDDANVFAGRHARNTADQTCPWHSRLLSRAKQPRPAKFGDV